jgi:putative addiction module component (TIGR02574 family)
MAVNLKSLGIDRLSVAERMQLMEEIWESITADSGQVPLTQAQQQDLALRLNEYEADPKSGSSWDEVKARLQSRP